MKLRIGKRDIGDIFDVEIALNLTNIREATHRCRHFGEVNYSYPRRVVNCGYVTM